MPAFQELLTLPLGNNVWLPVCFLLFFIGQISLSLQPKLMYLPPDFIYFSLIFKGYKCQYFMLYVTNAYKNIFPFTSFLSTIRVSQ